MGWRGGSGAAPSLPAVAACCLFVGLRLLAAAAGAEEEACHSQNPGCAAAVEAPEDHALLQMRSSQVRERPAPELGAIADYYVGRAAATPTRPPAADRHHLGEWAEPMHPTNVTSLLGASVPSITSHPKRFFADGVLSEDACRRLRELFDRHPPSMKTVHNQFFGDPHFNKANEKPDFLASVLSDLRGDRDFPLLLALRQRMLESVRAQLDDSRATESFTHLIHRVGHSGNEGMGTHADNCQFQPDGVCHGSAQCCAWRTHTVFTYLSDDDVDGGEFYFARSTKTGIQGARTGAELEMTVAPKCGQMVGFSAGGENLHGVLPLRRGSRYSLGLWLTEEAAHFEDEPAV